MKTPTVATTKTPKQQQYPSHEECPCCDGFRIVHIFGRYETANRHCQECGHEWHQPVTA